MSKTITYATLNADVERAEDRLSTAVGPEETSECKEMLRKAREALRMFTYKQKKCFTAKGRVIRY